MAILTFDLNEGLLETFGDSGRTLEYAQLFGSGHGWVAKHEAVQKIQRIRDVRADEAGALCKFLSDGRVLSQFRARMSPEDWQLLLDALPDPSGSKTIK